MPRATEFIVSAIFPCEIIDLPQRKCRAGTDWYKMTHPVSVFYLLAFIHLFLCPFSVAVKVSMSVLRTGSLAFSIFSKHTVCRTIFSDESFLVKTDANQGK